MNKSFALTVTTVLIVILLSGCKEVQETKHPFTDQLNEQFEVSKGTGGFYNDGFYRKFYFLGQKEIEGNYSKGKRQGEWKSWYMDGGEKWVEKYNANGNLEGEQIHYFENGKVKMKGMYSDGNKIGTWFMYDDSSKLIRYSRHEKGKDVSFEGKWLVDNGDTMEFTSDLTFKITEKSSGKVFTGRYEIKEDPYYHIDLSDNGGTYEYQIESILENEYRVYDVTFKENIHAMRL